MNLVLSYLVGLEAAEVEEEEEDSAASE